MTDPRKLIRTSTGALIDEDELLHRANPSPKASSTPEEKPEPEPVLPRGKAARKKAARKKAARKKAARKRAARKKAAKRG